MRIAPLAEVKAQLSAYIEQCETQGPIVITRNGKAVAVLLAPVDDDDLEGLLLARSPRFQSLLAQSRRASDAAKVCRVRISGKRWPKARLARRTRRAMNSPGYITTPRQRAEKRVWHTLARFQRALFCSRGTSFPGGSAHGHACSITGMLS
ncbi:MAG: type II toxin-antitoxin system Phd/YefM family antitoxin [Anaerolineae bacterium]|nr:MAG: type II toxin-antitoxin system Phd/YefM family antitoxin [Anaerolineae bacterium]